MTGLGPTTWAFAPSLWDWAWVALGVALLPLALGFRGRLRPSLQVWPGVLAQAFAALVAVAALKSALDYLDYYGPAYGDARLWRLLPHAYEPRWAAVFMTIPGPGGESALGSFRLGLYQDPASVIGGAAVAVLGLLALFSASHSPGPRPDEAAHARTLARGLLGMALTLVLVLSPGLFQAWLCVVLWRRMGDFIHGGVVGPPLGPTRWRGLLIDGAFTLGLVALCAPVLGAIGITEAEQVPGGGSKSAGDFIDPLEWAWLKQPPVVARIMEVPTIPWALLWLGVGVLGFLGAFRGHDHRLTTIQGGLGDGMAPPGGGPRDTTSRPHETLWMVESPLGGGGTPTAGNAPRPQPGSTPPLRPSPPPALFPALTRTSPSANDGAAGDMAHEAVADAPTRLGVVAFRLALFVVMLRLWPLLTAVPAVLGGLELLSLAATFAALFASIRARTVGEAVSALSVAVWLHAVNLTWAAYALTPAAAPAEGSLSSAMNAVLSGAGPSPSGVGPTVGIVAGLAAAFTHATLTFAATALRAARGHDEFHRLGGLWRDMPYGAATMALGVASAAGLPMTAGGAADGFAFILTVWGDSGGTANPGAGGIMVLYAGIAAFAGGRLFWRSYGGSTPASTSPSPNVPPEKPPHEAPLPLAVGASFAALLNLALAHGLLREVAMRVYDGAWMTSPDHAWGWRGAWAWPVLLVPIAAGAALAYMMYWPGGRFGDPLWVQAPWVWLNGRTGRWRPLRRWGEAIVAKPWRWSMTLARAVRAHAAPWMEKPPPGGLERMANGEFPDSAARRTTALRSFLGIALGVTLVATAVESIATGRLGLFDGAGRGPMTHGAWIAGALAVIVGGGLSLRGVWRALAEHRDPGLTPGVGLALTTGGFVLTVTGIAVMANGPNESTMSAGPVMGLGCLQVVVGGGLWAWAAFTAPPKAADLLARTLPESPTPTRASGGLAADVTTGAVHTDMTDLRGPTPWGGGVHGGGTMPWGIPAPWGPPTGTSPHKGASAHIPPPWWPHPGRLQRVAGLAAIAVFAGLSPLGAVVLLWGSSIVWGAGSGTAILGVATLAAWGLAAGVTIPRLVATLPMPPRDWITPGGSSVRGTTHRPSAPTEAVSPRAADRPSAPTEAVSPRAADRPSAPTEVIEPRLGMSRPLGLSVVNTPVPNPSLVQSPIAPPRFVHPPTPTGSRPASMPPEPPSAPLGIAPPSTPWGGNRGIEGVAHGPWNPPWQGMASLFTTIRTTWPWLATAVVALRAEAGAILALLALALWFRALLPGLP